jgi:hypothetical protein
MKLKKLLHLNSKKVMWIIALWIVAVVLHNLIFALFNMEEAVFLILAVLIIPLYTIISLIYTLFVMLNKHTNKKQKNARK